MSKPLIVHVLFRLDYGGLENGLVNLINRLPADRYRHAVVCLCGYSDFRQRIQRQDVEIFDLGKRPGKDLPAYVRLWRLLRRLRPRIVHTRNQGTIDCAIPAFLAAVPVRLHGCHGWDADDLYGDQSSGRRLRRLCHPFITGYTAVSRGLSDWLAVTDGIDAERIRLVYNGVDCDRFRPAQATAAACATEDPFVIGTVGRLDKVKDHLTLVRAFAALVERRPGDGERLQLAIVGDGVMRAELQAEIDAAGLSTRARIHGWRDDIVEVLREFTVFCLPSLNEGISNTLLEAMASGLPVVATAVGGNTELVVPGETGALTEAGDAAALAAALENYLDHDELVLKHGQRARQRALTNFSLERMVAEYDNIYSEYLHRSGAQGQ